MSTIKHPLSIRIHLDLPNDEPQSRRSSFDLITPIKTRLSTNSSRASSTTSPSLERQRTVRLSSVSSNYAQFLKQRDLAKNKKTVSYLTKDIYIYIYKILFFFVLVITRRSSFIIIIK